MGFGLQPILVFWYAMLSAQAFGVGVAGFVRFQHWLSHAHGVCNLILECVVLGEVNKVVVAFTSAKLLAQCLDCYHERVSCHCFVCLTAFRSTAPRRVVDGFVAGKASLERPRTWSQLNFDCWIATGA